MPATAVMLCGVAGHARDIFVRIDIRGPMDRVWHLTQTPAEHRRWDVRFTDIDYLPRPDTNRPQQFRYATRIGFGLAIQGEGETVGERDAPDGTRTTALKFGSDDPKSLIRKGSGYWKYLPRPDGVRFLTRYDYDVRFGSAGRLFDRSLFRPLMGRATAWSFDRLRLWIEDGLDPCTAMRAAVVYTLARGVVAFVWVYHGLVPKLIYSHPDELAMLGDLGLSPATARTACVIFGGAEVVFGLLTLALWRARWPLWLTVIAMPLATLGVASQSPRFLTSAFNAMSLNVTTLTLAVIALLCLDLTPSASRCSRVPVEEAE